MKWYASLFLLLWLHNLNAATVFAQTIKSAGVLNFKCNGQLFTADSTHARGYALKQTDAAFIKAANAENIVLSVEWKGMKGPGIYIITAREGNAVFTINHKTYVLKQTGDFIKIVISTVKQSGSFLLLSGTFEGQLQDKNGNKIKISEGKFETISL
ncbi:hypothetical protein [Ferruginibacter sp.]|nr:hypothetical protein [Ferruginibacter sp.]